VARRNAGVHYMGVLRRIGRYVPIWPRSLMPDAWVVGFGLRIFNFAATAHVCKWQILLQKSPKRETGPAWRELEL
jgi:hypothetical protein